MLKDQLRATTTCHLQAALSSFNNLCNKPIASLITALVIAITLTLPVLFWVFVSSVNRATIDWQNVGHMSLYLKPTSTEADQNQLLQTLSKDDRVSQALLKTPAQGLKELQQHEGLQGVLDYLPENPLPPVIEIIPRVNNADQLEQMEQQFKTLAGVEQIKLDVDWVKNLNSVLVLGSKCTKSLFFVLALAVVFIIGNTLRLALQIRYEEIRVLKLIGATDAFILRPFLYSGIWYGLIGAIFSILFVNIILLSLSFDLQQLAIAYNMQYLLIGLSVKQAYLIVLMAIMLGWLGARTSVNKQLSSIEAAY